MQPDAAAASQASAATLEDLKSQLRAAKLQAAEDREMIENLSQRNTSLAGEASNTQAAQFEAALEKSCARLHDMQLIVLLNNIRTVVLKSPKLTSGIKDASEVKSVCDSLTASINLMFIFTSHGDCKETGTGR